MDMGKQAGRDKGLVFSSRIFSNVQGVRVRSKGKTEWMAGVARELEEWRDARQGPVTAVSQEKQRAMSTRMGRGSRTRVAGLYHKWVTQQS